MHIRKYRDGNNERLPECGVYLWSVGSTEDGRFRSRSRVCHSIFDRIYLLHLLHAQKEDRHIKTEEFDQDWHSLKAALFEIQCAVLS